MAQFVPVATHVEESAVINAPIENVWGTLMTPHLNFSWWELVQSSELKVGLKRSFFASLLIILL
jgi:uncharacterized protein YndB with AHSA1/START domain